MNKQVDINCDLGEGLGNEALIMPYLSSCNIACGGHAGNEKTMKKVALLAHKYKVKIGAHPSFPDKEYFGRRHVEISASDLYETVKNQVMSLIKILKSMNLELHHIKPHGALYNVAVVDEEIARILVDVIYNIDKHLILYAPYQSAISNIAAEMGIKVMFEGFADRHYNDDLTLVSRHQSNAVIHDAEQIFEQVFNMISNGKVIAQNGVEVELKVDTVCLHGDHENVLENLIYLKRNLTLNSIKVK